MSYQTDHTDSEGQIRHISHFRTDDPRQVGKDQPIATLKEQILTLARVGRAFTAIDVYKGSITRGYYYLFRVGTVAESRSLMKLELCTGHWSGPR